VHLLVVAAVLVAMGLGNGHSSEEDGSDSEGLHLDLIRL
jgi:hypothetical protein